MDDELDIDLDRDELRGRRRPPAFTIDEPGRGTFVGDAAGSKVATLATGLPGDCEPQPRSS